VDNHHVPLRLGFKTKIEESKKQAAFVHAYEEYVETYDNKKVQSTFKKLSVHAFTRATVLYGTKQSQQSTHTPGSG
jgi:hypothetical protein